MTTTAINALEDQQDHSGESEKTVILNDEEQSSREATPDIPPDGGYGWVCVVAVACVNAHTCKDGWVVRRTIANWSQGV